MFFLHLSPDLLTHSFTSDSNTRSVSGYFICTVFKVEMDFSQVEVISAQFGNHPLNMLKGHLTSPPSPPNETMKSLVCRNVSWCDIAVGTLQIRVMWSDIVVTAPASAVNFLGEQSPWAGSTKRNRNEKLSLFDTDWMFDYVSLSSRFPFRFNDL